MKAVVLLLDSLNRRFVPPYFPETIMPNLERLRLRSSVFDCHWTGSLPCMPARRDIFTGRLEFLERGWGPLEPFDVDFVSVFHLVCVVSNELWLYVRHRAVHVAA